MSKLDDAAQNLVGLKLDTGWNVIEKIEKVPGQTGSFFSVCYKIERDGEICFLKAFDFSKFIQIAATGKATVDIMTDMLNAHRYERDLSELCKSKHLDKVVIVKEAGEILVSGHTYPIVPYLIFDMADGDVRKRMMFSNTLDVTWKLKSLHSISVGLKQLHGIEVSHQDLKPSNILLFNEESKIGDVGRSLCRKMISPYDGTVFNGDWNYAPPEILYGVYEADWTKRTFSTDCYLLGSMITFYFTGMSMTALIRTELPDNFSWDYWRGSFDDVKEYILNAYDIVLQKISLTIPGDELKKELKKIIEYLCYPIPEKRGHPKSLHIPQAQYSLERFITTLAMLYKKSEFNLLKI
ncbi:hypothetical protein BH10BAC2_BH10BAC2_20270 [soil metagenome]